MSNVIIILNNNSRLLVVSQDEALDFWICGGIDSHDARRRWDDMVKNFEKHGCDYDGPFGHMRLLIPTGLKAVEAQTEEDDEADVRAVPLMPGSWMAEGDGYEVFGNGSVAGSAEPERLEAWPGEAAQATKAFQAAMAEDLEQEDQEETLPAQGDTVAYSQGDTVAYSVGSAALAYPVKGKTVDVADLVAFEEPTCVLEAKVRAPLTVRSRSVTPLKLKRDIAAIATPQHSMSKIPRLLDGWLKSRPGIPEGCWKGNEMDACETPPRAGEDEEDDGFASQSSLTSPQEYETGTQLFPADDFESLPNGAGNSENTDSQLRY